MKFKFKTSTGGLHFTFFSFYIVKISDGSLYNIIHSYFSDKFMFQFSNSFIYKTIIQRKFLELNSLRKKVPICISY